IRLAHPDLVGTVARLTEAGAVVGTPGYLAPEQATAKSEVGVPADVWALGAVLYACLTGRAPFRGADVLETLALTVEADPVTLTLLNPGADTDLVEICLKCLRKQPGDRYASADDVAKELGRWCQRRRAKQRGSRWPKRLARMLGDVPEVVPVLTGLIVNRLA